MILRLAFVIISSSLQGSRGFGLRVSFSYPNVLAKLITLGNSIQVCGRTISISRDVFLSQRVVTEERCYLPTTCGFEFRVFLLLAFVIINSSLQGNRGFGVKVAISYTNELAKLGTMGSTMQVSRGTRTNSRDVFLSQRALAEVRYHPFTALAVSV